MQLDRMEWAPLSLKRKAEIQIQVTEVKKCRIEKVARKRLRDEKESLLDTQNLTKKLKVKQAAQKRPREEGNELLSAKRMRIQRVKRAGEVLESGATKKARRDNIPVNYAGIILRDVSQKLNIAPEKMAPVRAAPTAAQLGRRLGILSLPKRARDETRETGPEKKRARMNEVDVLTKTISSLTINGL